MPPAGPDQFIDTGTSVLVPLSGSIANASVWSGLPSSSSSASFRSEFPSPSLSGGVEPSSHGSVPLSISSALSNPSPSSSSAALSAPVQTGGGVVVVVVVPQPAAAVKR